MVVLTENMVLSRARAESLATVRNLNLWGNDLTDVSVLQRMTNVEVLSLSVNKIASLREFQHCPRLTEIYLRKNAIDDLNEVRFLINLKQLRVLWLNDNACAHHKHYRTVVIKALPFITKLDNADVTPQERDDCKRFPMSAMPELLRIALEQGLEASNAAADSAGGAGAGSAAEAPSGGRQAGVSSGVAAEAAARRPNWQRPDDRVAENIRAAAMDSALAPPAIPSGPASRSPNAAAAAPPAVSIPPARVTGGSGLASPGAPGAQLAPTVASSVTSLPSSSASAAAAAAGANARVPSGASQSASGAGLQQRAPPVVRASLERVGQASHVMFAALSLVHSLTPNELQTLRAEIDSLLSGSGR